MNYAEKHIVENYFGLFESLGNLCKLKLIKKLKKSLKSESNDKELEFYKSFGAFPSDKSSDEINSEIKLSRKFRKKEINF